MNTTYILYNPLAGNGKCKKAAEALKEKYADCVFLSTSEIAGYDTFLEALDDTDRVILAGGDGTLNRFANSLRGVEIKNEILYAGFGSGNDFLRDVCAPGPLHSPVYINPYLKELPTAEVNGQEMLFINNVGFGIDGYCCETGDLLREKRKAAGRDINYTLIAIKGLLFHYKPTSARVLVDGTEYHFQNVWLAPTMHGRYYGGGMMAAPGQSRTNPKTLSLLVMHAPSRLKALMIFPSIFKGTHIRHEKYVSILEGRDIFVEFDRPAPLQVDGETVRSVRSYRVHAAQENRPPS